MGRTNVPLQSFNKGVVSPLGLARTDLGPRIAMSAEVQTNWMPRTLGSMMLRPGLEYTGNSYLNRRSKSLDFVFSLSDTARIELTPPGSVSPGGGLVTPFSFVEIPVGYARVWVDDQLVTRDAVATTITNGSFTTDLSGWTDNDEAGAVSSWSAGNLSLKGSGGNVAAVSQVVSVASGDSSKKHGVTITILRGEVTFIIEANGDEVIDQLLTPGVYSFQVIPYAATLTFRLKSQTKYASLVSSIQIDSAGVMVIPTPWGAENLENIRKEQSGDIIFVACKDVPPARIMRFGEGSWGISDYVANDGPFGLVNSTSTTITPSGLSGDITLTSSRPIFKPSHAGGLFSVVSADGQTVQSDLTGAGQFTDPILVTGINNDRIFNIDITGTWAGTLTQQYSVGSVGSWIDSQEWTANASGVYDDGKDNSTIYYRIGFKAGEYTSGSANVKMKLSHGSITGIARIVGYTSSTVVSANVLVSMGGTTATDIWYEGAWSGVRGYPSAISIFEGRLWFAGKDKFWGTYSGSFISFDDSDAGDSAAISKSIGFGPVDTINWLVSAERLIVGAEMSELTVRSSSLDEPLTPSNSSIKSVSTQGSYASQAVNIDGNAAYIQRCQRRIYMMAYDSSTYSYGSQDLTSLSPDISGSGFVQLAVQRQPDTRLHCRRTDGKVAVMVFDRNESVNCWVLVETSGVVVDICILPGDAEDQVYYTVRRDIGDDVFYTHERFAIESECQGGLLNKQADSFVSYSGTPVSSIAYHFSDSQVSVWADGKDIGLHDVTGGVVTLASPASNIVVGKPYVAKYKSTKLAYAAQNGTALTMKKKVNRVGVILRNTHIGGLKYGRDFDHMDNLPRKYNGKDLAADYVFEDYDGSPVAFNGSWETDSRLCLQAQSPRPCTLLAAIVDIEESD